MALTSMTGFGRADGAYGDWQWHWEVKTVNARGLDVRLRMPPGCEVLEQDARKVLQAACTRGACQAALTLERQKGGVQVQINDALAGRLAAELQALARKLGMPPPSLDAVLGLRGVVETADTPDDEARTRARDAAIASTLAAAIEGLVAARLDEGMKLSAVLDAILQEIDALVVRAADLAATTPERVRARLQEQVSTLLAERADMPNERIIQEVALLAAKADIREELDRLHAHSAQARVLLAGGGAVGRKLDFLAQEFNREANTLCAKSSDTELTRIGLDMKAAIEQLREQVQNVE